MKYILFLTVAFLSFQITYSQDTTSVSKGDLISIDSLDIKPEFSGGMGDFYKFIAKNFRTPEKKA